MALAKLGESLIPLVLQSQRLKAQDLNPDIRFGWAQYDFVNFFPLLFVLHDNFLDAFSWKDSFGWFSSQALWKEICGLHDMCILCLQRCRVEAPWQSWYCRLETWDPWASFGWTLVNIISGAGGCGRRTTVYTAVRAQKELGAGLKKHEEVRLVFDDPMDNQFFTWVGPGSYQKFLSRRGPGWGRSEGSVYVKGGRLRGRVMFCKLNFQ